MIKVFPSVLAADLSDLAGAVKMLEKNGADGVHFDVMDGHFVPNISYGPGVCAAVSKKTNLPLDVHLMVTDPLEWIAKFASAGAKLITFHVEAEDHIHRVIQEIHNNGVKAGVALNPCTGLDRCRFALEYCDVVLLMTVNPGFGGQKFIPGVLNKIKELAAFREKEGLKYEIEVDGGVNRETALLCREAGATILVAGSAVFKSSDPAEEIQAIRG